MDLVFKHLDVNVLYWEASYHFYAKLLGMQTARQDGRWALFGSSSSDQMDGWTSLVFQLNSGGRFPGYRIWGHYQGIRPSIQVENLEAVVEKARRNRVIFTGGAIQETGWGRRVEFTAPEMIRWSFSEAVGRAATDDLSQPVIGHVEIKVNDMAAQAAFYRDVLGFEIESQDPAAVLLSRGGEKPWLVLEPTGGKEDTPPTWGKQPDRAHPVVIGFLASDLQAVATRARDAGVSLLTDVGAHLDEQTGSPRDGFAMADFDGNAIQVFQS